MSKPAKNVDSLIPINWIEDIYRDHPNMRRVNAFKEQLKQEDRKSVV